MGRGTSKVGGGGGSAKAVAQTQKVKTPTSILDLDFNNVQILEQQMSLLPVGALIKIVDQSAKVTTLKKIGQNKWSATQATSDDGWSISDVFDDKRVASTLKNNLSNTSIGMRIQ